jgi:hypothetical protein
MADDDVQLTDLAVIQRYSLAVRGATASRGDLVAALQADLDWLTSGRRPASGKGRQAPEKASVRTAAASRASGKAPAKAAGARTPRKSKATRTTGTSAPSSAAE